MSVDNVRITVSESVVGDLPSAICTLSDGAQSLVCSAPSCRADKDGVGCRCRGTHEQPHSCQDHHLGCHVLLLLLLLLKPV